MSAAPAAVSAALPPPRLPPPPVTTPPTGYAVGEVVIVGVTAGVTAGSRCRGRRAGRRGGLPAETVVVHACDRFSVAGQPGNSVISSRAEFTRLKAFSGAGAR